ncbi:hypothetical protein [Corynebacterium timonense]|uniref:Uncharacterized protein n=1 Tax=Corynebacterium timonense TaxID=441500 RepID=A0A1H1N1X7_9CORY|nr:hypothetical protein [Corynebacterium timonense]SDR92880.1 hypothetical protein SAMN04488539_0664 [Corynebacterium timonense]
MRTFRQAVLAGATATALALGSAPAASAEADQDASPSLSSQIGAALGAYDDDGNPTGADGRAIFGSSTDLSSQPVWAQLLYATTILASITSVVGLLAAPVYNFVVHGPFSR